MTSARRPSGLWLTVCALAILSVSAASAAENAGTSAEVSFFAALLALILVGRLLGEAMNRIGQPSVMGQLLAGILLGPSLLGWLFRIFSIGSLPPPKSRLDAQCHFTGRHPLTATADRYGDRSQARPTCGTSGHKHLAHRRRRSACLRRRPRLVSADSLLPDPDKRLLTSLFLGTALAISSIKIVAVVVREMGFERRNLGQIIVASAILEDTIGWIIIAVTFSLAAAGHIDFASVAGSLIGTAVFLFVSFTVGRRLVSFLIRWTNDNFESDFPVITTILVDHDRDGANHALHRRPHRARRIRVGRP